VSYVSGFLAACGVRLALFGFFVSLQLSENLSRVVIGT
jgi:hypothetical protein